MVELNPEQWAEAERLFQYAAELPPEERPAFLARECLDPLLRQEVESLLAHFGEEVPAAEAAIQSAAAALTDEPDPDERLIGTRLGPYRVEAIAGHGGMGAVYRASRDDEEFRQLVAIKLVRAAAESPSTLRRFRQERQILARLSHPNIARLLDGGSTPEGVPYLVMEFIKGEPITVWCERQSLGVQERLRLFMRVCEGVDSAHRDLVVHRDLKPANILVTRDGTPKLLDFGIAKLLDPDAQIDAATITNLQAMTPDYASPEQVRGEPVSTSADVYALGLILYELLTGRKAQKIVDLTPAAIARMVCQTEPSAPASLKPQLAGDLDNIIRMAIRKEPDRRYASAGVLAHDIQRHLEGRPVIARRDTFAYRLAKFLRRNRIPVAVVVLIAASLSGGLALEYWLGAFAPLPHVLQVVQLTQTGRVEIVGGVVTDGSRVYFTERSGGNWSLAEVSVKGGTPAPLPVTPTISQPDILDISPDRSSLLVAGQPGEGGDRPLWIVPSAGGPARRIGDVLGHAGAWSPDGRHIVFARGPSLFRMNIDGTNRRKLLDTPGKLADWIRWSPTGGADVLRLHIVANDVVDRALWEMAPDGTGLHRLTLGQTHGAGASNGNSNGAWTQSGRYYLFRSVRGTVASLWAVRENRHWLPLFDQHPVQIYSTPLDFESLAPSPDGKRVFITAGYERRELVRYDAGRGQFLPYLSGVAARWVSFSKDGRWVAYTTVADGALWRSRSDGSERMQLTPPSVTVGIPRWSPDGSRIAFFGRISGKAGTVYIIPSAGGVPEEVAPGLGEPSWSADGNSLLLAWLPRAGGPPPGLYVMDLKTHRTTRVPGSEGTLRAVWSPDSRYIAGNRAGSEIVLFDFHTRRWTHLASGSGLGVPMWSRDSRHLYYQEVMGGVHQPIFRILVGSGRIERVVDARQIPQSNVAAYLMCGLAPADAPVATLIRSNSDIYALDVDLP